MIVLPMTGPRNIYQISIGDITAGATRTHLKISKNLKKKSNGVKLRVRVTSELIEIRGCKRSVR